MSEWIEWNGGKRPVGQFERIEVEFENGGTHKGSGGLFDWRGKFDNGAGIVRYRLLDTPSSEEAKSGVPEPIDEYTKTLRDEFAMACSEEEVHRRLPKTVGEVRDELIRRGRIPEKRKEGDVTIAYTQADSDWLRCMVRYDYADAMLAARKAPK